MNALRSHNLKTWCKLSQLFKIHLLTNKSNLHYSEIVLLNLIKETKRFVSNHPSIIITKADKGNCTVVLDKDDYLNKVNVMLADSNTYTPVPNDPTSRFQHSNNTMIDKLINNKCIPTSCKHTLKINNATSPKIYCLPKIHIQDLPLRPIVANINTPNSRLSKYIANILSPLKYHSEYYLENSLKIGR